MGTDSSATDAPYSIQNLPALVWSGTRWSLAGTIAARGIALLRGVLLARLLTPLDFGLYGLATVVVGFFTILSDGGAGAFLIQKSGNVEESSQAAFRFNLLVGLLLVALMIIVGAPVGSAFYNEPSISSLIVILAMAFAVQNLGAIPQSLLRKRLDIRATVTASIAVNLVSLCLAVAMAVAGLGALSFVLSMLAANSVGTLILWRCARWRPVLGPWSFTHREVWNFSRWWIVASVVWYLLLNGDNFLVGKLLGTEALGYYALAYSYAMLLPSTVGSTIGEVLFPTLSRYQQDFPGLRSIYLRANSVMASIAFPTVLALSALAPDLFAVVFGSKWNGAVLPFQLLLFASLSRILYPDVVYAIGRPELSFWFGAATLPIALWGIVAGTQHGIAGVALAVVMTVGIAPFITLRFVCQIIGLSYRRALANNLPYLGSALVAALALHGMRIIVVEPLSRLALSLLLGPAIYLGLGLLVFATEFRPTLAVYRSVAFSRKS